MKKLLKSVFVSALFPTTPLFAIKGGTVDVPDPVTVGSTKIAPGQYKVSYEGSGPVVKVTVAKSSTPAVVFDAKLVPAHNITSAVLTGVNSVNVLQEIDLMNANLIVEPVQDPHQ